MYMYSKTANYCHCGLLQVPGLTLEGRPEVVAPPVAVPLAPTLIMIQWSAPSNPQGVITAYSVYTRNSKIGLPLNHAEANLTG